MAYQNNCAQRARGGRMFFCPFERREMERAALARKYPDTFNEVHKDGLNDCPSLQDMKDTARWCLKTIKASWVFIKRIANKKTSDK